MRYRLHLCWYRLRLRLFDVLYYLGWTVAAVGFMVGIINSTVTGVLAFSGYDMPNKATETIFGLSIGAIFTGLLILCIGVAQLPGGLPPDKQPRR